VEVRLVRRLINPLLSNSHSMINSKHLSSSSFFPLLSRLAVSGVAGAVINIDGLCLR
jgi:hypothetical protein